MESISNNLDSEINSKVHPRMKTWKEIFPDNKVDVMKYLWNLTWKPFFEQEYIKILIANINKELTAILEENKGNISIFPYPELLFETFNLLNFEDVILICLGQDPYFNYGKVKGEEIFTPEAMGKCFSVKNCIDIPSSLQNVYKNLKKYKHFKFMPKHGNLTYWNAQGCLLLNTALTVEHGYANSHAAMWIKLTDEFIKWITTVKKDLVIMLWGGPASKKNKLINTKNNHKIIISSHPCGMSCWRKMGQYEAFDNQDHFGMANKFLTENEKPAIIWQLP